MWNFLHSNDPANHSKSLNVSMVLFPFLTLTTPFLVFLDHSSYGLFRLEVFIGILGFLLVSLLCTAGMRYGGFIGENFFAFMLITFFLSIQFRSSGEIVFILILVSVAVLILLFKEKFHSIAVTIFATFFIVTLFQTFLPNDAQSLEIDRQDLAIGNASFPRIIHLILDEHIGLEGIPTDIPEGRTVKNQLLEFFLIGKAFTNTNSILSFFRSSSSVQLQPWP